MPVNVSKLPQIDHALTISGNKKGKGVIMEIRNDQVTSDFF
jgi:hypothetical protein